MKILTTLAVGAVAASALFAVAPASAQHRVVHERVVHQRVVVRHDGPRMHHRQVCTTRYEHHRRVRVCR